MSRVKNKEASVNNEVEEESPIAKELIKYQKQVNEIQNAIESVKLMEIEEMSKRLTATEKKLDLMMKLPQLLTALRDLKSSPELTAANVRGSTALSALDKGELD